MFPLFTGKFPYLSGSISLRVIWGMVDFTGSGLRIADCEPMQIVYFFGKKPQEFPVATRSYAMRPMPPRKWLYMSWL